MQWMKMLAFCKAIHCVFITLSSYPRPTLGLSKGYY